MNSRRRRPGQRSKGNAQIGATTANGTEYLRVRAPANRMTITNALEETGLIPTNPSWPSSRVESCIPRSHFVKTGGEMP